MEEKRDCFCTLSLSFHHEKVYTKDMNYYEGNCDEINIVRIGLLIETSND